MPRLGPRIVVAGTHSGVGKTTVATGLMAALRAGGHKVGAAKVGPDFIDPAYHKVATGRPSRSLDEFLSGRELLASLAAKAAEGCDLLVVEGVMGMFDGSSMPGCDGSTAAVARAIGAPVLLVVDAAAMSGSVAALVHGFATFDPAVRLGGVILNNLGSQGHATLLREALAPLGVPVLGAILRDDELSWRDRYLGLVPVAEQPATVAASVRRLGEAVASSVDLGAVVALAASAEALCPADPPMARRVGRCRLAVCAGPAFSFNYEENLELFEQAGAELAFFDPTEESQLPAGVGALYCGGGFPEVFAEALSCNEPLLSAVGSAVREGLPTWAECGGYMWLADSIDGRPMAGAIADTTVAMSERLALGYRTATTRAACFLGPPGLVLRGHEYHRSVAEPAGDGLELEGRFGRQRAGHVAPNLFASYLHQHLSATPVLAERFVAAAAAYLAGRGGLA